MSSSLRYASCLALLASTALAGSIKDVTTLKPITKVAALQARADDAAVTPTTSVTLDYGLDTEPLVHVDLAMQQPAVLLESISSIENVTCADGSLAVSFTSKDGFDAAVSTWSNKGDLVFFTNHLGNCDTEAERGVFLVNNLSSDANTLTITASAQKKDVASTASNTAIAFKGVPVGKQRRSVARRAAVDPRSITVDDKGLTIGGSIGLPANMNIYSFPPYLSVTADKAEITASVTFSGYLDYDVLGNKLKQLYADVNTNIDAEVGVTVAATAEYRDSFTYNPGQLSYMIIDVPGIITLGPELLFDIGLDVDVGAGVNIHGTAGVGLQNGGIHIDFLNQANTTATAWTPTHNANLDLSQSAEAKADAWVDVTFQLIVQVLGGAVDLTAGVTARPRFNNEFAFAAEQTVDVDAGVSQPGDVLACAQGLSIKSDFSFSLVAFVTKLWSTTVYNVEIPVADKCYTWLSS